MIIDSLNMAIYTGCFDRNEPLANTLPNNTRLNDLFALLNGQGPTKEQ